MPSVLPPNIGHYQWPCALHSVSELQSTSLPEHHLHQFVDSWMTCLFDAMQAIMQRPVSNEDVVLNNMVSFLKLQQPVPLQQKLIKQTVEQYVASS